MEKAKGRKNLFPAEKCGLLALVLAGMLFFLCRYCALVPLVLFLLFCAIAPFLPSVSFFLPIVSRARSRERGVVLTFDDGPDPVSTLIILELLSQYDLTATFFVVGVRAARYPELIQEILDQGHTIGNHSWDHDYALMLRSPATLDYNIRKTQNLLEQQGIIPRIFRPPMGITGSRLGRVLERQNLLAVNYSCRALDRGNRQVMNLSSKVLKRLRPGDIIMLHDLPPIPIDNMDTWRQELERLFESLSNNYTVEPLAKAIGRPVMESPPSINGVI